MILAAKAKVISSSANWIASKLRWTQLSPSTIGQSAIIQTALAAVALAARSLSNRASNSIESPRTRKRRAQETNQVEWNSAINQACASSDWLLDAIRCELSPETSFLGVRVASAQFLRATRSIIIKDAKRAQRAPPQIKSLHPPQKVAPQTDRPQSKVGGFHLALSAWR